MVGILKKAVVGVGDELVPLVIVGGFLSAPSPAMWGNFEEHLNDLYEEAQKGEKGTKAERCETARRRRVIFAR